MHHQFILLTWPHPFSHMNMKEKSGLAHETDINDVYTDVIGPV